MFQIIVFLVLDFGFVYSIHELCPDRDGIFDDNIVSGYKSGNEIYYCLIARFKASYFETYTPAQNFPFANADGHLFFIKPTWKTNQIPNGCSASCRLFNPIAPFSNNTPKYKSENGANFSYIEYSSSYDALNFPDSDLVDVKVDIRNTRNPPNNDPCSYIGFKIDTASIANQIVRYAFRISKILCTESDGKFATLEIHQGMNASEPGFTDCPSSCDCTRCPPECPLTDEGPIARYLREKCIDDPETTFSTTVTPEKDSTVSSDTTTEAKNDKEPTISTGVTTTAVSEKQSSTSTDGSSTTISTVIISLTSPQSCVCALKFNCGERNGLCYLFFIFPLMLFVFVVPAIYLFLLIRKRKQRSERTLKEIASIITIRKSIKDLNDEMKHIEEILRINGVADQKDLLKKKIWNKFDKVFTENKTASDDVLSKVLYGAVTGILREKIESPQL